MWTIYLEDHSLTTPQILRHQWFGRRIDLALKLSLGTFLLSVAFFICHKVSQGILC